MKSCSNDHPEITFSDNSVDCPLCITWNEFGKLSVQVGKLQKQIEKRSKIDEAVKIIYSALDS